MNVARTAPTGPRGEPILSTTRANQARDTPLAVMQPTLLQGTKVGLRNHEEVSQDKSRPLCNWAFRESNRQPPHFINRGNYLPDEPIASYASASLARSQKALVQTQELLHLSSTASPTSKLSSIASLPYTCITRRAMKDRDKFHCVIVAPITQYSIQIRMFWLKNSVDCLL